MNTSNSLDSVQPLTSSELLIRDMLSEDLTQIMAIERNAQGSPWGRLSFEESLNKNNVCRVVEARQQVIAYHVCSAVLDELHILNLVAAKPYQGIGLGHHLMQDILARAQGLGSRKIFLEVRESNSVAQGLYLKWKFRQLSVRKNYYRTSATVSRNESNDSPSQAENALVFVRDNLDVC